VEGQATWKKYAGGKAGVRHKAKIDALVRCYVEDDHERPDNITAATSPRAAARTNNATHESAARLLQAPEY